MKNTAKLTFSGIMAALAVVFMLIGYFPYLTYAVPAVSGLFIMIVFIETGTAYAIGAYAVSAVISLIIAEKEVAVLYLLLFGFYPVLKAFTEKIKNPVFEWILKIAVFNSAAVLSYFVVSFILGISFEDFGVLGKYGALIFLAIANGVFVLYDFAVSRVAAFYVYKFSKRIQKIIRK